MINQQLINPASIAVIGGSDDFQKPGGKVVQNLLAGNFKGKLYLVNPKNVQINGIQSCLSIDELPQVDLAILSIPAKLCPQAVDQLTRQKNTRAFIVLSAGFSEESAAGAELEHQMVEAINRVNGCLIGPNCIGVLSPNYNGVFTLPIPKLHPQGCDFISGSGATAIFVMEAAIPNGLSFAQVFSVGNSAQLGVEEVLEYLDESFLPESSSKIKLLYIENIKKPAKLLKHARSLVKKGCRIAAIKAGSSDAGSRAASSHTGALATSDTAVSALFKKAGIVRCYSREELATVAGVFMHPPVKGKNFAIITHAGGPAVMLTDALSSNGMAVPSLKGPTTDKLLTRLYPGSSVANPIDFLATGTAQQLGDILDTCENELDEIDAICVIFGTPGLWPVYEVYEVLHKKMLECRKPVFPVLPSVITAKDEINWFIAQGHINFPDEVALGNALTKIYNTPAPPPEKTDEFQMDDQLIRQIIDSSANGYLAPVKVQQVLDAAGIPRVNEIVTDKLDEACNKALQLGFPVVMKVVGPVHKSDIGGVKINIDSIEEVKAEFIRMMAIPDTYAILIQPMARGRELFAGVKRENPFGHLIACGLGGIFIEVLKDVQVQLCPVSITESTEMIKLLKSYKLIEGIRGQESVNQQAFAEIIARLSQLCQVAPEIAELDLNPLLGNAEKVIAVDARIRIEK
jgi:acetyltransferase